MNNNKSIIEAGVLGKQHRLLREAAKPFEQLLVSGTPAPVMLLALKKLRYLSVAHERAEHEALRSGPDQVLLEDLHKDIGLLWSDFMNGMEQVLDSSSAVVGEDLVRSGKKLTAGLHEHWRLEEETFIDQYALS